MLVADTTAQRIEYTWKLEDTRSGSHGEASGRTGGGGGGGSGGGSSDGGSKGGGADGGGGSGIGGGQVGLTAKSHTANDSNSKVVLGSDERRGSDGCESGAASTGFKLDAVRTTVMTSWALFGDVPISILYIRIMNGAMARVG